jgi:hypothetical protein
MKSKTFNKKLVLKKKTISNLNNQEMVKVNGGTQVVTLCPLCEFTFTKCNTECPSGNHICNIC